MNIFKVEKLAGESGHILQAGEKGTARYVEIWAEGENGGARPMTKAEAEILKKDITEQGELVAGTRNCRGEQKILNRSIIFLPFYLILLL